MWLIDRQTDGVGVARIPLPALLQAALIRWYVGKGSRGDEAAGITLVQQARIGKKWLACDCRGAHRPPPILTPAYLSEAETYYLRRLTSTARPEHSVECAFFLDQIPHRITKTRKAATPADLPTGYFEVLRPAPEKLARRPDDDISDDRTINASTPRLARLLWWLLHTSGRNLITPLIAESGQPSIAEEFRAIRLASTRIQIAPGIELARALWTHGGALHSNRVYAGIRHLARRWPREHAPQGFLTLFAERFEGSIIYPAGCDAIEIANRVQSPSARDHAIKGPYLVLVVIGQYPEAHGFAPLRAYAQPIFSGKRFVPIASETERSVLHALFATRRMLDRRGFDLTIEKPVHDRLTPSGVCRPDFLLEAHSRKTGEIRRLVVETNDDARSDNTVDLARRLRCLRQIAPIVEIARPQVDASQIFSVLSKALSD